jgi:hypothetical protein
LIRKFVVAAGLLSLLPLPLFAGMTLYENDATSLKLSGDLRLRLEQDWDSRQGNGEKRDDRLRLRGRGRLQLAAAIDENWSAVLRLRTGSEDSQQSPHVTIYDFDDNDTGSSDLNFDLWYGQYRNAGWEIWAGRSKFNIWKQDEFVADDDATALGLGITYEHSLGAGTLSWKGGLGSLPVGLTETSGQYASAQAVYNLDKDAYGWTFAGGYLGVDADPDDTDGDFLLTENGGRDYQTVFLQAQFRTIMFERPLKLGADAGSNLEDYDDEPPGSFSEFHKDDTDFYAVFANWGQNKQKGDWLFGYYYLYVEALAYSSSYAQDDWVRWGNADQTRATNMKGSEFRAAYSLADNINITGRLFIVDAIDLLNEGDVAKEDGNRARIDLNIKF